MSVSDDLISHGVNWTDHIERMLAQWCDQAKCFEWMHNEAYTIYNRRSRIIMISSIILSSVGGLSNVITGGYTVDGFELSWVFGSISIFSGLTNLLQDKLGYTVSATEHKQYTVLWGIIRRKIEEELVLPIQSRKNCGTFLKCIRQDINQVSIDGNAKIPSRVRQACYNKFNNIPNFDIPDICGQVEHTQIYIETTPLLTTLRGDSQVVMSP